MNEENLRNRIRILLDEIQSKADPAILNRCRSIFRQEVPFFNRSYMAAYLLLLGEGSGLTAEKPLGNAFRSNNRNRKEKSPLREKKSKNARMESPAEDPRTETARVLGEEESVQLFVSVGRNRKVFPREILALIISRAGIDRDDIGLIRVLDNYSFIQVRNSVSDTVIEALNGRNFRGRTLTVNHARSRKEEENETEQ